MSVASGVKQKRSGRRRRILTEFLKPPQLHFNQITDILALLSLGAAAVILVIYLVLAVNWQQKPFTGMILNHNLHVEDINAISEETWSAREQGLEPGDRIVQLLGKGSMWDEEYGRDALSENLAQREVGQLAYVVFEPGDGQARKNLRCYGSQDTVNCTTSIELQNFPAGDFTYHFVIGYLIAVITFFSGLVVLWRRSEFQSVKFFVMTTSALSVVLAGRFDLITTYKLVPVWISAAEFLAGMLLVLAMVFPQAISYVRRYTFLRYAPVALTPVFAAPMLWFYEGADYESALLLPVLNIFLTGMALIAVMFWRRQYSRSPILREQVTFVGLGALMAFVPMIGVGIYYAASGGDFPFEAIPLIQMITIFYPLSVAYSLLQYHLLETDRVIPEVWVYGLLSVMLLAAYSMVTFALSYAAIESFSASHPALIAATILVIVTLFVPLRNYLRNGIDKVMFRQRRSYQERREAFNRRLTNAVDLETINRILHEELETTIAPLTYFLFIFDNKIDGYSAYPDPRTRRKETDIIFRTEGGLVTYLREEQSVLYLEPGELPITAARDRSQLAVLGTPLLIGLEGRNRLNGMICIGARRGGDLYSYEDLRFAESLADQVAIAVERARFVDDLEHRVQVQDVLSQVSHALNFAIDFDTLLELIFTQTSRIINADHFYIVLRDYESSELYYSFYSAGDERLSHIEGVRWPMGMDVVSEVILKQNPMLLENYTGEQLRRNVRMSFDIPEVYAWMAVPLTTDIAEIGVMGVMAIGSTDPGVTFVQDQLQLFWDIANIAASAIDKIRLFAQTEERAAQLKALNDISSRLASELEDVNRLLEIITENAVSILRCEAGSLLLVDEDSDQLVFRVVTGGAGENLLNTRISLNAPSLVADAIKRVAPVIVNNPMDDPRWHGDISGKDIEDTIHPGEFHSRAILTVPLVAQGVAVGALQVINKLSGGGFTQEDADLANTFAGQAAVAIQNARLFETQDKQLLSRVEELDRMAAIDHSLTQTLILDELVDVIMNWALGQTDARFGSLFIITRDRQHLRLVGSYGYPSDSMFYLGKEEEEKVFPIATGILGRVVDSGAASMVTDVHNDPHYVESAPECQSQIAVPLISGAEVNGIILIETNQDSKLSLLDMDFLSRLADHASAAINNALLYNELQEQQSARAEFVSFIAHELKTPITSMKGYTQLLMRPGVIGELNDQQMQFLNTVNNNIEHMQHLVNDIRDLEFLETKKGLKLQLGVVDFNNILLESLRFVQQAFDEKEQPVERHIPDELPEIWGDQTRLTQVMINFLTNANKYSPPGKKVEIYAEPRVNEWDTGGVRNVLYIQVKDNGLGISKEDQERLFEKYFRSTNPEALDQKGTGLGLTLTKRLIESHGGKLWFESEPGKGTAFHFTIPLASEILEEHVQS